MYGTNSIIPGILNSTPLSLRSEIASRNVKDRLSNIDAVRKAFRAADNDERIKRARKSRKLNSDDE